jgi:tetratricopeptide (TPR) repeat protein
MDDEKILRSWKEISKYLKCDRKTCARWETHYHLPVHRINPESTKSRVFAYAAELDRWMAERKEKSEFPEGASRPSRVSQKHFRVKPMILAGGILALAGPAAWIFINNVFLGAPPPTIALQEFGYPSEDADCAYLANGMKVDLVRRLNLGGNAKVMILPSDVSIPPNVGKGDPSLPSSDFIIRGEVRKTAESIRWDLRLDKTEDGKKIWDHSWTTGLGELPNVLNEADQLIRASLDLKDPPREPSLGGRPGLLDELFKGNFLLSRIGAEDRNTTALYFQGKLYSNMGDQQTNETAIMIFQKIIHDDPTFGLAYVGLARCYVNYVNFNWKYDLMWLDKADEMLARAAPYVSTDAEYYRQRIENLMMRDIFTGSDSSGVYFPMAREGLTLYPYHGGLNSVAGYCHFRRFDLEGRESDLDEAVRLKYAAFWADPFTLGNIVLGQVLLLKKEFDKAINICSQLAANTDSSYVSYQKAEIQYYANDLDASESVFRRAGDDLTERSYCLQFLGMIAARRGDRKAALEALREIELMTPKNGVLAVSWMRRASIRAGLGNTREALEDLRMAFSPNAVQPENYVLRRLIELDRNFDQIRPVLTLPLRAR